MRRLYILRRSMHPSHFQQQLHNHGLFGMKEATTTEALPSHLQIEAPRKSAAASQEDVKRNSG